MPLNDVRRVEIELCKTVLHPSHRATAPKELKLISIFSETTFHQLTRMHTALAWSESARLLSLGYLARSCLWRKAWTEPFANLKDVQDVIRYKWHVVDDQTVREAVAVVKALSSSGKAQWRTYSALSADQLTDDYRRDGFPQKGFQ